MWIKTKDEQGRSITINTDNIAYFKPKASLYIQKEAKTVIFFTVPDTNSKVGTRLQSIIVNIDYQQFEELMTANRLTKIIKFGIED